MPLLVALALAVAVALALPGSASGTQLSLRLALPLAVALKRHCGEPAIASIAVASQLSLPVRWPLSKLRQSQAG